MKNVTIAILGDSISEGIGKRKYNYCEPLRQQLEKRGIHSEIINLAHTGSTICYVDAQYEKIDEFKPDIVISFLGNVDGLIRPNINHKPNYIQYLPKRYQQNGMLNPRPYYSKKWYKRMIQRLDSWSRWHMNKLFIKLQGEYCWVELEEFAIRYRKFVDKVNCNDRKIFILGTVPIKEKYFPGTTASYKRYSACLKKIAMETNCKFIDVSRELSKYDRQDIFYEDGFHLSKVGYDKLAICLANEIKKIVN